MTFNISTDKNNINKNEYNIWQLERQLKGYEVTGNDKVLKSNGADAVIESDITISGGGNNDITGVNELTSTKVNTITVESASDLNLTSGTDTITLDGITADFSSITSNHLLQKVGTTIVGIDPSAIGSDLPPSTISAVAGVNTFSAAVTSAAALLPSETNPICIILYAGIYSETGATTISVPPFVAVFPINTAQIYTVIRLDNASFPPSIGFLKLGPGSSLENIFLLGNNNCDVVLEIDSSPFQAAFFNGMTIAGGKQINMLIKSNSLFYCGDNTISTSFYDGGIQGSANSTMIEIETGCQVFYTTSSVSNFMSLSGVTGYRVNGTSVLEGIVASINFMENGLIINDTAVARLLSTEIIALPSGTSTGIMINDSGEFDSLSNVFKGGWNKHIVSTAITTTVDVQSSRLNTDKISLFTGSNINLQYFDLSANTPGNHIIGNQLIGKKNGTTSSTFGEGSITLTGMHVWKFDSGAGFTDITSVIIPLADTPVTVFDTLVATNAFYIGYDSKFSGFSTDVTLAFVKPTSLDVIWEVFDGVSFVPFVTMVTHKIEPYETYNLELATVVQSQNVRFDSLLLTGTNWQQTTVNGVNKFWVRYIIANTITTSGIIKNVQLLGDQMKINANGFVEHFGKSRSRVIEPFDFNSIEPLEGKVADANVYFGNTLGIERKSNSFDIGDAFSFVKYLSAEQSTDSAVELVISFFTDGTDVRVLPYLVEYACVGTGEPVYAAAGNADPPRYRSVTGDLVPIITAGTSRLVTTKIRLDSGECSARTLAGDISDMIMLRYQRTTGLNVDRLIIVNIGLTYLKSHSGFFEG